MFFMVWVNDPENMNWLGDELFGNRFLLFPASRAGAGDEEINAVQESDSCWVFSVTSNYSYHPISYHVYTKVGEVKL